MENLVLAGILVAVAVVLIALAVASREWQRLVLGGSAFGLFVIAVVLVVMTNKPSSPASSVGSTGKDFYQVLLEEETSKGTTIVVAKDSSGKFYVSEFNEPLGVTRVLVVDKEKFRPLLSEELEKVQTSQK